MKHDPYISAVHFSGCFLSRSSIRVPLFSRFCDPCGNPRTQRHPFRTFLSCGEGSIARGIVPWLGSTEGTSGVTRISTRNAGGISRAQNRIPNLGKGCAAGLLRRLERDVLNSLSAANSVGNCFPISTAHISKGTTTGLPPILSIHRTLTMDVENNNIYT